MGWTAPMVFGRASESFVGRAAASCRVPRATAGIARALGLEGLVLVPQPRVTGERRFSAVPDGNRCVVLEGLSASLGAGRYAVGVKGAFARAPLYGETPLDFALRSDFGGAVGAEAARVLSHESWLGEAPYGAQGETGAARGIAVTELADGASILGFHVCPLIAVHELPADVANEARDRFWYRRHEGRMLQELRLLPSNVRLHHESDLTLGGSVRGILDSFGVGTPASLDAFLDRAIASGLAALTIFARTLCERDGLLEGLDYDDVWLDKDCVVAPDGTLHFADLEGLAWVAVGPGRPLERLVRDQFDRNCYELFYALDVLLRAGEELAGRRATQAERRRSLATRLELALDGDPVARCRAHRDGLDVVVSSPCRPEISVTIRAIDLR